MTGRSDAARRVGGGGRIGSLDGLRGLAALAVVAQHMPSVDVRQGWVAVDLFFVLSGYLVTSIVLARRGPGFLRGFYAGRALRLWPAYLIAVAACLALDPGPPGAAPLYLAYLQQTPRYLGLPMPPWRAMSHGWSLAVEWQFYLIWPALLILAGRRVVPLCLGVALGSLACRMAGVHNWLLAARADGLALGSLLAAMEAGPLRRLVPAAAWAAAGASALVVAALALRPGADPLMAWHPHRWAEPTAAALGSFAVVAWCVRRDPAPLRWAPLAYLGAISYGLYLYHYPVLRRGYSITLRLGLHDTLAGDALLVAASAGLAAASWHLVERPIRGMRRQQTIPETFAREPEHVATSPPVQTP